MIKYSPLNDGISSIELIEVLGTDLTVVNAARVSMGKVKSEFDDSDKGLVKYLASHNHWTPFSQPQLQLRIKMPIFLARQYFKHQIGITRNEISRRYVDDTPEFFAPEIWRARAANVKQGSKLEAVETNEFIIKQYEDYLHGCESFYQHLLDSNVAPEQARMALPQSMYTEFVETGSLATYARIMKLRLDSHAQVEIQEFAKSIALIVEEKFPECYKALM